MVQFMYMHVIYSYMYTMLLFCRHACNKTRVAINYDVMYETRELLGETAGLLDFGSGPAPAVAGHESGD